MRPTCQYTTFWDTTQNILECINHRIFNVKINGAFQSPPQPKKGQFKNLHAYRNLTVNSVVGKHGLIHKWTFEQFIFSLPPHKRKLYIAAAGSLARVALRLMDAFITMFTKSEKTECLEKEHPVPRAIQPRTPRYCYSLGRIIKPMEEPIYEGMANVWNTDHVVFKGMNALEQGECLRNKWDKFSDPVAVGLDASRFDQHCSKEALMYEHAFYLSLVPKQHKAELKTLLRMQLDNRGVSYTKNGDKVKYRVEGCRMSGDMNTAMGNCILMCAMLNRFCYEKNLRTELANNGDDCVMIMEKTDLNNFMTGLTEWFLNYGFTMVVEQPVSVFEKIIFCQTQPVSVTGRGWVMTRNPFVAMSKDCIMTRMPKNKEAFDTWRSTVAIGGLSLNDGLPVMPNYYNCLKRGSKALPKWTMPIFYHSGFTMLLKGMKFINLPVTIDTRISFWKAFDILPEDQKILESTFDLSGPMTPQDKLSLTAIFLLTLP